MAEIPAEHLAAIKEHMKAIDEAVSAGGAIVCYTRCWPCQFAEHQDPPRAHTWMDREDAAHAGHAWPLAPEVAAANPCACPCAKENPDA